MTLSMTIKKQKMKKKKKKMMKKMMMKKKMMKKKILKNLVAEKINLKVEETIDVWVFLLTPTKTSEVLMRGPRWVGLKSAHGRKGHPRRPHGQGLGGSRSRCRSWM